MTYPKRRMRIKKLAKPYSLPNCRRCPFEGEWCKQINLRVTKTNTPLCPIWYVISQWLIKQGVLKPVSLIPPTIPVDGEEAKLIMDALRAKRRSAIMG